VTTRLQALSQASRALEARLREGGGADRAAKQHAAGKLTARERVTQLTDADAPLLELGLLVAHDRYDGQAPAAGVITAVGYVAGRECVIVANDATVKAGSWWPETIGKILRAQECAMRSRVPIIYLVDSAGVNLPYQGGVFPGQYGAARIFYYNSLMRRYLRVPQIAAVMGQCVAGGAYLPALSDVILMVKGSSFMGLGGPNLVKGATGQVTDAETLGGAVTHTAISGVAHHLAESDADCLRQVREMVARLPDARPAGVLRAAAADAPPGPANPADALYDLLPTDHRMPYDMRAVLASVCDAGSITEFQSAIAPEMICADAKIEGMPIGVIANARGLIRGAGGAKANFGGIIYAESAEKTAYFIEKCNRLRVPLVFVQDVSGFMVGVEAEQGGIIRSGAHMVEAMATATVPKIVLTVNHASGAGYYAMAGQGFDPDFILSWPSGRMAVMEGEAAVQAVHGPALQNARQSGAPVAPEVEAATEAMRADYETQLDAVYAGARGFIDALVYPEDTRAMLALALRTAMNNPGSHLGPYVLGGTDGGR